VVLGDGVIDSEVIASASCEVTGDENWGRVDLIGADICRDGLESAVIVREMVCRCRSGRRGRGFEVRRREGMLSKMHFTTRPQRRHMLQEVMILGWTS
jgi:hypothetical protein